jgi:hypothetical protein
MIASRTVLGTKTMTLLVVAMALVAALTACERPRRGPFPYTIETDDARGLKKGASVTIAGVEVGKVRAVALVGRKARIHLALTTPEPLTLGTCATIASYNVAGPMHVELDAPEGKPPLADGMLIRCVHTAGDHDKHLSQIFRSVGAILDLAVAGKGVIGRLLRDEKLADQMERWLGGACLGSEAPATAAKEATAEREPAADGQPQPSAWPKIPVPPPPIPVPGPMPVQPKWKPPAKSPSKPKVVVPF